MKNKSMTLFRSTLIAFLLIAVSVAACAAAMVTAAPDGSGGFILRGKDLKDMTFITIDIGYETEVLINPVLSNGAISQRAQLSIVNKQPGNLSFTIARENSPFSGSGVLVNMSFSKIADLPGRLTYINASYTNREGTQNTMETAIYDSPVKEEKETGKGIGGAAGQNATRAAGGNRDVQESRSQSYKKEQSVLDRFREYTGSRNPAALKSLFYGNNTAVIRQEPPVALSDGKTPVTVSVMTESSGSGAQFFILKGVDLISLKTADNAAGWVLELMPAKGKHEASLTVSSDSATIEYPLAIAPALADCADLESGDLPGYVRDYIRTANSLVSAPSPVSKQ